MRNMDKVLIERKRVVECLKHGICPCCGFDTERKYSVRDRVTWTYCSCRDCKFHKRPYQNIYKWLVHHRSF